MPVGFTRGLVIGSTTGVALGVLRGVPRDITAEVVTGLVGAGGVAAAVIDGILRADLDARASSGTR
jgi:hypothetical protein